MSRITDFVDDIDDSKETLRLAVCINDLWSVVNSKGVKHLEMVVMDSKVNCDRIQVLVRRDHTSKWKQLLKEDITCIINNGNVYDNDFQWKLCDHPKKFVFFSGTTVKPIELNNIPSNRYFFKDFSDILKGECKMDRLQGVVHEIENCQSKAGGKKIVISFKLKDLGLSDSQNNEKPSQSTQTISTWSGSTQYTSIDKFVYNVKCMLLTDLSKLKQEIICVTGATTLKFVVPKNGWFYYGCTDFTLKAPNPENPYKYGCGENVMKPIPRYKVEIHVVDGDTKIRFVFWDSGCFNIIGKTTDDMRKSMIEDGEDDPMVYPDEHETLLKKKMAFRVMVQPTFNQGSVQKLLTDESSIDQILQNHIKYEVTRLDKLL
ncbi:uncharacterized protein LOC131658726 [Vicia villosa]|uniref:uncharacterized protein LOC131658726 n=1 Tax=Vicia villosa TaxID=3911 RepID=UPI00273C8E8C|nr:uncharacterized protein LOC131658726 [Vicia villosa]